MDPLSLSMSIAGLASLAQIVVEKGYKYLKAVEDREKDVRNLLLETSVLCDVLDRLVKLAIDTEVDEDYDMLNGSLLYYNLSFCY